MKHTPQRTDRSGLGLTVALQKLKGDKMISDTFSNWPDDKRMAFRQAIMPLCSVAGYAGKGIQLRLPHLNDLFQLSLDICAEHGLKLVEMHYFPLGSDNAPLYMRHECHKYPGRRGFWLNGYFEPA